MEDRAGETTEHVHNALGLVESAHIAFELRHLGTVGVLGSIGVGLGGLVLGVAIHHMAEDARAEHIAGVHALGVR